MDLRQQFNYIYQFGVWNNNIKEIPLSGPGSSIESTRDFRDFLDRFCLDNNVDSIVDLGCGDMTWMPMTRVFNDTKYTGIDIVDSVIQNHKVKYPCQNFICLDIINDDIPSADVFILRDVLFHLNLEDVGKILEKIIKNKLCKFLIVTSCRNTTNIDTFDSTFFHQVNLRVSPFNMKNYSIALKEDKFNRDILIFTI